MIERTQLKCLQLIALVSIVTTVAFCAHAKPSKNKSASPQLIKRVKKQIRQSYGDICESMTTPNRTEILPALPGRGPKLIQDWCEMGAYQLWTVYFLLWPDNRLEMVHFPIPVYTHRIEKGKDASRTVIEKTTGFRTEWMLANPVYDPKQGTIQSFRLHRGVGDSQTRGMWRWRGKQGFVLEYYDTDQSLDGVLSPTVVFTVDEKRTPDTFQPKP